VCATIDSSLLLRFIVEGKLGSEIRWMSRFEYQRDMAREIVRSVDVVTSCCRGVVGLGVW
jgi:hypothetical protein